MIDNKIVNDKEKINSFFDIIINEIKLEKEIKNLIIYKKALYNSESSTENNLLKILNPILNSDSIWKSHSLYLMAEYFYSKNEKEKSKEFLNRIIELENSNPNIKIEAQKRLTETLVIKYLKLLYYYFKFVLLKPKLSLWTKIKKLNMKNL